MQAWTRHSGGTKEGVWREEGVGTVGKVEREGTSEGSQFQRQMVELSFPGREGRGYIGARRVFGRTSWLSGFRKSCRRPSTTPRSLGTAGF